MKFKVVGLVIEMNMMSLQSTMKYFGANVKTANNEYITGKWQQKKK